MSNMDNRSHFARLLKERGLPVKNLTSFPYAAEMAQLWRNPVLQVKVADLIAKGYREVQKKGALSAKTKESLNKALDDALGKDRVSPRSFMPSYGRTRDS
jgi:hypothetical protein